MSYNAIITKVRVSLHSNADRLALGHVLGTTVVIGKDDFKDNDLCIYFGCDGLLSDEFCKANDLYRRKDEAGNYVGGMFEEGKPRVRAIKLRGERSDGFLAPLSCLNFTGYDISKLKEGEEFCELNGVPICKKYETPATKRAGRANNQKKKEPLVDKKLFPEHVDTEYLFRNLEKVEENSLIYLLEKKHGTSVRAGCVPVNRKLNIIEKLLRLLGVKIKDREYKFVVGSRRVIKDPENINQRSFHRNDLWHDAVKHLSGLLHKNEMVFGEIVGYEEIGKPIMGVYDNKKVGKEFVKQYGEKTVFKYGCKDGEFSLWIYRIGIINEDGILIDLPYEAVKKRCRELGVNCSEEFLKLDLSVNKEYYTDKRNLLDLVNSYLDKPSSIDSSHVIEGIVVQVEGYPNHQWFKEKSFTYKVLEDMIKSEEAFVDMEEAN